MKQVADFHKCSTKMYYTLALQSHSLLFLTKLYCLGGLGI